MNWDLLTGEFLRHREDQGLAPETLSITLRWLETLRLFFRAERVTQLEQITPNVVRGFYQKLLWSPSRSGCLLAPNSLDQGIRVVRTFLRWAHGEGCLSLDPALDLVLSRPAQPPRRLLTAGDLERVRRHLDDGTPIGLRDAALFELALQVPVSQLVALELDQAAPGALLLEEGRVLLEAGAARALAAYLDWGRPGLVRDPAVSALFLTRLGGPGHGFCVGTPGSYRGT